MKDIEGSWFDPKVRQEINDEAEKQNQRNVFQRNKVDTERNKGNDHDFTERRD